MLTRQQTRARERADAFRRVNAAYGHEPRRARRGIARAWATQAWRKRAALTAVSCGLLALFSLGATPSAQAQGSRKDDIVFNAQGRPMAGSTVRVCTSSATGQPCAPLAQIYSDLALTQALANPLAADGMGNYSFYAAPGRYMIEIDGPGITTKQIPNVILPSDPSSPTFTSVTTTSGISAFSLTLAGNLTVNGSAAVVGSLTVGGAPVPSTNADNQWTASQRFKGPDPWRDFTAYMPAGGCSSTDDPGTWTSMTGTISAGSHTLATSGSTETFKNGCGIAVLHAGATSTLTPPSTGCTISTIVRSSGLTTATCTGPHGIMVFATDYGGGQPFGIQISGVTDSSFNGTYPPSTVPDATHITYSQALGNASSTGGTISGLWGYAHGVTGSTTYKYKFVSIDSHGGYSPASGEVDITNGNATLSIAALNYNWINIPPIPIGADRQYQTAVYGDRGLGGAYTCLGATYDMSYSDYGSYGLCPYEQLPSTPPASAGNQTLNTTVTAGGGTSTLTLADAAINTATSQYILHDESSFLRACTADVIADQAAVGYGGPSGASFGCYIPAAGAGAAYWMSGTMPTEIQYGTGSVKISVAGTLNFPLTPWFINGGQAWDIEGVGGGAPSAANVPQSMVPFIGGFVIRRNAHSIIIKNFSFLNAWGNVIWAGATWDAGGYVDFTLENLSIIMSQNSANFGSPLFFSDGILEATINKVNLSAIDTNGAPAVHMSEQDYNNNPSGLVTFNDLNLTYHGFLIDGPGGNRSGGGWLGPTINNRMLMEDQREDYFINHDNGPNAPNSNGIIGRADLSGIDSSDGYNGPMVHQRYGNLNPPGGSSTGFTLMVNRSSYTSVSSCGPDPSCDNAGVGYVGLNGPDVLNGFGGVSITQSGVTLTNAPLILQAGNGPALEMTLPPPVRFQVASTGSGSLAADTWCAFIYAYDSQATAGFTNPSPEVCTTVGAGSSITYGWNSGTSPLAKSFRIYYGVGSGHETKYYDTNGPYAGFTITSDGGTVAALPTGTPNAYVSNILWASGPSCILCTAALYPSGGSAMPLGIGVWPTPYNGVKLDVGGGTIRGQNGFISGTGTTPNVTLSIAKGASALGTSPIASGTCGSVVTATATGVATTDNIMADFNADPTSTTGYAPSTGGMLTIIKYPTAGNVNFKVCNSTGSSITPGAVTLNWSVVR